MNDMDRMVQNVVDKHSAALKSNFPASSCYKNVFAKVCHFRERD